MLNLVKIMKKNYLKILINYKYILQKVEKFGFLYYLQKKKKIKKIY